MAHALVLGCGYTGRHLSRRLLAEGHRVTGTTRTAERARDLEDAGIEPRILQVRDPESVRGLAELAPEVCFDLIPPLRDGEGSYEDHTDRLIQALGRAPLECFVYVSSTSVYGDRDGGWVDESTTPDPDTAVGRARLEAERTVLRMGWTHDTRPRIVRAAGIYGPGRTLRQRLLSGDYAVVRDAEAYSNRIHVDDLARALIAAWRRGRDGRIYNACDDRPLPSAEYGRVTAEQLGVELEEIELAEARERYSPGRLARKLGSKRVSNRRLREELGLELRYPSVREGVPAALEAEED